MSTAENIQTMQAFLGYFNPAEAKRMAQGGGARLGGEGETAGAARTRMLQAFLGHFNPSRAKLMEQGGGARPKIAREVTSVRPIATSQSHAVGKRKPSMSKAERIQALQAFLGYFNPAEAERMAQGGGAQLDAESEASRVDRVSALTDHVADESFWRSLSALQDAFPDLEVVIENSIAEGDQVAIRFAVPSH